MHNFVFTRLMLGGSHAFQPTALTAAAAEAAALAEPVKLVLEQWRDVVIARDTTVKSASSTKASK